jgi:hypothetical protein
VCRWFEAGSLRLVIAENSCMEMTRTEKFVNNSNRGEAGNETARMRQRPRTVN